MLLLAIDTSQDIATISLGRDQDLLAEHHFHHKMNLLQRITPNLEQMLSDAGHTAGDVDAIIVSLGPGSFTGLRIGVTIAKSLAYTLSKPIVGIGTLDAMARGVAQSGMELVCPMVSARANEVYWSLFDSLGTLQLAEHEIASISHVLDSVEARGADVLFCGTGALAHSEAIRHRFGTKAVVAERWSHFARGAALLDLGLHRLHAGRVDNAFDLVPLYIRKPTPVVRLETGEFEHDKAR